MKRRWIGMIAVNVLFIAGCGTTSTNTTTFDGLQMSIPQNFKAIDNSELDSYQIINKILKAYKNGTETLIIARSSLSAHITPEEYATTSEQKLAQGIPGYQHIGNGTARFTCGKVTINGYTHSFAVNDTQTDNPGKTYIIQYYFIAQDIPYIISEADRTNNHYSDFTSMLTSLHCN